ncbi:MAG: GGDEF domain-containing protein [Frankiaceae bacterium]
MNPRQPTATAVTTSDGQLSAAPAVLTALAGAPLPAALFDAWLVPRWTNAAFTTLLAAVHASDMPGRGSPTEAGWLQRMAGADVQDLLDGSRESVVITLVAHPLATVSDATVPPAGARYWSATFFAVREGGELTGIAMVAVETTEATLRERALAHRATHDPLTGLPNRAEMYERLAAAQARAGRGNGALALLMLDLDDFKAINDRLGHLCGDHVLVDVARRLRHVVRDGDTVARLGGDEFALICEGLTGRTEVAATARRAAAAIASPMVVDGVPLTVTASIGATVVMPDETVETVASRADRAMYDMKPRSKGADRRAVLASLR